VLAGGTESMSRVPYFAEGARWGMRVGHSELVDGMYRDVTSRTHVRIAGLTETKVCAVCVQVAEQYGIRPTSAHVNGIGKPALKPR
jgi:acetyl-CoA acetyltransferase